MNRPRRALALLAAATVLPLAGCGSGDGDGDEAPRAGSDAPAQTVQRTTRVEVVKESGAKGGFDPAGIYRREAPGVVTVLSTGLREGGRTGAGQGSGFVISDSGEIATNAHVVTSGQGASIRRAEKVFVRFADNNQVPARIVGFDPFADAALLRVDPRGLTLRPLPFGKVDGLVVGSPVAAIGSPFGEEQSLSIGVISAVDRSIESLTGFATSGAIQTDAAINHGNSGGPLLNADGEVIGINSQIRTESGDGTGVGFAVPADVVQRSLGQLRKDGRVHYAYLGISSREIYPQLAERFDLPVRHGVWVQEVIDGGPADDAGLRAGTRRERFQESPYRVGGDIVISIGGRRIRTSDDLSDSLAPLRPGQKVAVVALRGKERRTVQVTLGERPPSAE